MSVKLSLQKTYYQTQLISKGRHADPNRIAQ